MKVSRLPPVDDEVIEALHYYRAIEARLGLRLVQEFEATIQRIVHFPKGWKPIGSNLRQCTVKGFPYIVVYSESEAEIVIIAFANTHRRPGYWRDRVKSL